MNQAQKVIIKNIAKAPHYTKNGNNDETMNVEKIDSRYPKVNPN